MTLILNCPSLGHYAFMNVLEHNEENRNHKKQSECAEKQTADSPDSNRNIAIGSDSARKHKRQHAKHHCCRCHYDGSETCLRGETAEATSPIPSFLRAVAYSVSKIAVFASNPINMISPICM